jgi:hypothetical protein
MRCWRHRPTGDEDFGGVRAVGQLGRGRGGDSYVELGIVQVVGHPIAECDGFGDVPGTFLAVAGPTAQQRAADGPLRAQRAYATAAVVAVVCRSGFAASTYASTLW